jgi:Tfp pilus assembly protein PilP
MMLTAFTVFLSGTCAFSAVQEQNVDSSASLAVSAPAAAVPEAAPNKPAEQPMATGPMGLSCSPELLPQVEKTAASLMSKDFKFNPVKELDPFVPFITPDIPVQARAADDEEPAESDKPLTPLQKMTVAEIETGLKAIMWGDLGRRAMVEDSAGKGYIVSVGTPAGERNGVVKEIQNDYLVIQQQLWNKVDKKKVEQDVIVKLVKKTDKTTTN